MSTPTPKWLRPSALPKLALCGHYRSEENAGEAAERGTKLDVIFREMIQKKNVSVKDCTQEEVLALRWAEKTALTLAAGEPLEAREEFLCIEAAGMTGTADLLCESLRWSADLKTGQIRNYYEQQAAYALGFMERYFVDEWTVYLLFADQEQVETYRFTFDSATQAIRDALAPHHGGLPPAANEYCGWCAKRFDCTARRESLGILPHFRDLDFSKVETTTLRDFVLACDVVGDYRDEARKHLLTRALAGDKVPGVSLVANGKTSKVVGNDHIVAHADKLEKRALAEAVGSISESKAKALLGEHFTDDMVTTTHGSAYVTVKQPKAAK